MSKKIQDIIYEDGAPGFKGARSCNTGRGVCSWGGFDESGFERNDDGIFERSIEDDDYESLVKRLQESERDPDEVRIMDYVEGFDPRLNEWISGLIVDITTEFGQTTYCVEPFDSEDSFTTSRIRFDGKERSEDFQEFDSTLPFNEPEE